MPSARAGGEDLAERRARRRRTTALVATAGRIGPVGRGVDARGEVGGVLGRAVLDGERLGRAHEVGDATSRSGALTVTEPAATPPSTSTSAMTVTDVGDASRRWS